MPLLLTTDFCMSERYYMDELACHNTIIGCSGGSRICDRRGHARKARAKIFDHAP